MDDLAARVALLEREGAERAARIARIERSTRRWQCAFAAAALWLLLPVTESRAKPPAPGPLKVRAPFEVTDNTGRTVLRVDGPQIGAELTLYSFGKPAIRLSTDRFAGFPLPDGVRPKHEEEGSGLFVLDGRGQVVGSLAAHDKVARLRVSDGYGDNETAISAGKDGSSVEVLGSHEQRRVLMSGSSFGGFITVFKPDGDMGAQVRANRAGGVVDLRSDPKKDSILLLATPMGGRLSLADAAGEDTVRLWNSRPGGMLSLLHGDGKEMVALSAEPAGGCLSLSNARNVLISQLCVDGDGSRLLLGRPNSLPAISLEGIANGGRLTVLSNGHTPIQLPPP